MNRLLPWCAFAAFLLAAFSCSQRSMDASQKTNIEAQTYIENAGGAAIDMVQVPAGKFLMGTSPSEVDAVVRQFMSAGNSEADAKRLVGRETPQHEVTISQSFYLGKYEVTQLQWRAVATKLPKVKIDLNPEPSKFKGDNLPVEQVSWEEAIEFCERLSQATGKKYRLPTEAEWEYACRGGTTGQYAGNVDDMGWYANNSGRIRIDADEIWRTNGKNYFQRITDNGSRTHAVGQKQANRFGLYDMHGKVWEWCLDGFSESYYSQSPSVDQTGPSDGSKRVLRGGGWGDQAADLRSAYRGGDAPGLRIVSLGFRLLRTAN